MNTRTVILSDLHLGRSRGAAISPRALQPLWQNATHLIINGDAAEIHHIHYREKADRQLLELIDLARSDRVDVTLIAGNHDPSISDTRHLLLHNNTVLVTHGDALHPAIAPWSPAAPHMKRTFLRVIRQHKSTTHDELTLRLRAAQSASFEEWTTRANSLEYHPLLSLLRAPRTALSILNYWRRYPHLAARFAAKHTPTARFIVVGHSHKQGIWNIAGRTILNTGCFGLPSKPAAVILENNTLTFTPITRRKSTYQLDNTRAAIFQLPADPQTQTQSEPAPSAPALPNPSKTPRSRSTFPRMIET